MFAVKQNQRLLDDGTKITTYTRDVLGANDLEVEAGTNGYQGGDSGHGCRTYFRIQNAGSTNIEIRSIYGRPDAEGLEVILGGDGELETIIRALKFITKVLEDEISGVCD